jgi:hypothetical protein
MRELSSRNASGLAWRTKHVLLVVTNPANEGKAVANAPDEFSSAVHSGHTCDSATARYIGS